MGFAVGEKVLAGEAGREPVRDVESGDWSGNEQSGAVAVAVAGVAAEAAAAAEVVAEVVAGVVGPEAASCSGRQTACADAQSPCQPRPVVALPPFPSSAARALLARGVPWSSWPALRPAFSSSGVGSPPCAAAHAPRPRPPLSSEPSPRQCPIGPVDQAFGSADCQFAGAEAKSAWHHYVTVAGFALHRQEARHSSQLAWIVEPAAAAVQASLHANLASREATAVSVADAVAVAVAVVGSLQGVSRWRAPEATIPFCPLGRRCSSWYSGR